MQDVLAQSTSGMASNLKDAIDTMYYNIANSNSGPIKDSIKGITELVSHWRELASVLIGATTAYSMIRGAISIHNRWIGANNSSTIQAAILNQREQASILKKASSYRTLDESEKLLVESRNSLTRASLRQLAMSKAISSEDAVLIAKNGQMAASQVLAERSYLGLNKSQVAYLERLKELQNSPNPFTRFFNTQGMLKFRNGLSSTLGMIFNWQTALFAAIGGAVALWANYKQHQEEIKQANEETVKNAQDGAKNLQQFLNDNPIKINAGEDEVKKQIEVYKNELQSSPVDMGAVITNIGTLEAIS